MVVDVAPVGLVGGWPYFYLGVVLKPHLHPLPHRVPANLGRVQSFRFLDCLFQLGLGLCLGFSQDVLVDGPARLRVAAGGVPALPATVLALAEVSLPLALRFAMAYYLLLQQHNIPQKRRIAGQRRRVNRTLSFAFSLLQRIISRPAQKTLSLFYVAQDLRTPAWKDVPSPNAPQRRSKRLEPAGNTAFLNTTDHLKLRTPPSATT